MNSLQNIIRIFFFVLAWAQSAALTQTENNEVTTIYKNYNASDGLPSNECYDVMVDNDNFLWVASDRGVSRYDGISFKNFGLNEGLPDEVVFKFNEQFNGSIWCSTISNSIFQIIPSNDGNASFHPYKFNSELSKALPDHAINIGFFFDRSGNLHYGCKGLGHIIIDDSGNLVKTLYKLEKKEMSEFHVVKYEEGSFAYPLNIKNYDYREYKTNLKLVKFDENGAQDADTIGINYRHQTGVSYTYRHEDVLYTSAFSTLLGVYMDSTKKLKEFKTGIIAINFVKNLLWVGTKHDGIYAYDVKNNFKEEFHFFTGRSITSVTSDLNGGLWFSSLENGLFHIPDLEMKIIRDLDEKSNTLSINTSENRVFIGYDSGELLSIDSTYQVKKFSFTSPYLVNNSIFNIEAFGDTLICAAKSPFLFYPKTNTKEKIGDDSPLELTHILKKSERELIGVALSYFAIIRSDTVIKVSHDFRVNEAIVFDAKVYLATKNGLFRIEDSLAIKINEFSESSDDIVDLAVYESKLYCLTSNGILTRISRDQTEVESLNLYVKCNSLHVNEQGDIYISSRNGIFSRRIEKSSTLRFFSKNDFPIKSEVIDLKTTNNSLWILTKKGPFRLSNFFLNHNIEIGIKEFYVNGLKGEDIKDLGRLRYNENELEFHLEAKTLNKKGINYKYKCQGLDSKWQTSESGIVRYTKVEPGTYSFRFATNYNGYLFSEYRSIEIKIKRPFWGTFWFQTLLIMFFCFLIVFIVFFILKRKSKIHLRKQSLIELRSQALRSQMNPHFTHNALNSIQNLIVQEENHKAAIYLSVFAKLMRKTLDASTQRLHSLKDELQIVEVYLKLESLRFNDDFTFDISIEDGIDLEETIVPPMLIQPLAENSIIHGLNPLKKNSGRIEVIIKSEFEYLIIEVTDNGIGLEPKKSNHSSKGLKLIKERLTLASTSNKFELFRDLNNSRTIARISIFSA